MIYHQPFQHSSLPQETLQGCWAKQEVKEEMELLQTLHLMEPH